MGMKKVAAAAFVASAAGAFLLADAIPANASAYAPYSYKLSVPAIGGWGDFCLRGSIQTGASNHVDTMVHANGGWCSGSTRNVPSGYLAGKVAGYRSGSYCGTSGVSYSNVTTWGWGVWATMCSNPSGSQEFHTVGYGAIYNDGSKGGAVGYNWFSSTSPSQNY